MKLSVSVGDFGDSPEQELSYLGSEEAWSRSLPKIKGWRSIAVEALLLLDLYKNKRENEVARLITIGAVRYPWRYRPGDDFIVLADPDDNLFLCS